MSNSRDRFDYFYSMFSPIGHFTTWGGRFIFIEQDDKKIVSVLDAEMNILNVWTWDLKSVGDKNIILLNDEEWIIQYFNELEQCFNLKNGETEIELASIRHYH